MEKKIYTNIKPLVLERICEFLVKIFDKDETQIQQIKNKMTEDPKSVIDFIILNLKANPTIYFRILEEGKRIS